jgi:hypothetical protein
MFSRLSSFLRESGKLYVLYLTAGIAAIPAGIIYAVLAVNGYDRWWTALPAIVLGFWMAKRMWKYVERKLIMLDYNSMASANAGVNIIREIQAGTAVLIWERYVYRKSMTGLRAARSQSPPMTNQSANQSALEHHALARN